MKSYIKKYSWTVAAFLFITLGITNVARASDLVPCEGTPESPCGFDQLLGVVNAAINYILNFAVLPIAVVVLVYGGYLYLMSGSSPANRTKANKMFRNLFIGIFFCLTAWVIVKVILETLGYDTGSFFPIIGH